MAFGLWRGRGGGIILNAEVGQKRGLKTQRWKIRVFVSLCDHEYSRGHRRREKTKVLLLSHVCVDMC